MQKEVTVRWRIDLDGEGGRIGFVERTSRKDRLDEVVMNLDDIGQGLVELRLQDLPALIAALQQLLEAK